MSNMDRPPQPQNIPELEVLLRRAGLSPESWGQGPTKTLDDLLREIADGESWMDSPETEEQLDEYGELVRVTKVLGVDVYAQHDGITYRLLEERQEFKDGRGTRQRQLITSLAEKVKPEEDFTQAVQRAVHEELGVANLGEIELMGSEDVWKVTQTYPGLPSKLQITFYRVTIPDESFIQEGYIEDQPDKRTYFVWEKVQGYGGELDS